MILQSPEQKFGHDYYREVEKCSFDISQIRGHTMIEVSYSGKWMSRECEKVRVHTMELLVDNVLFCHTCQDEFDDQLPCPYITRFAQWLHEAHHDN